MRDAGGERGQAEAAEEGGEAVRGRGTAVVDTEDELHWLDDSWVVPQTVEGANELWETLGMEGWERGNEPPGWGPDGEWLVEGREGMSGEGTDARGGKGEGVRDDSEVCEEREERRRSAGMGEAEAEGQVAGSNPNPNPNPDPEYDQGADEMMMNEDREEAGAERGGGEAEGGEGAVQRWGGGGGDAGRVRSRKRRGQHAEADGEEGWQGCEVGEYQVERARVVAGERVIRLADVVAGRRRTDKRFRRACRVGNSQQVVCIEGRCRLQVTGSNDAEEQEILSSVGATSGLSGEGEDRRDTIRRQEKRGAETTELRRGYVVGAAWDEGNMIQAMARLKNPTIAWRYGDG